MLNNFAVAAQVAKEGGCKGFMFDVEQYNEGLFDYGKAEAPRFQDICRIPSQGPAARARVDG